MKKMAEYYDIKGSEENVALVTDIFTQGDSRYYDSYEINLVANFLDKEAIIIEKSKILEYPCTDKEISRMEPPQAYYKLQAKKRLESDGYKILGFELLLNGGRVDVLAKNEEKGEIVAVECCSCRVSKAIDYLEEDNVVLWIVSLSETGLESELPFFIVRRGVNWLKTIRSHKESIRKSLEKIKSPADRL